MNFESEDELKHRLGIESWRNLSKEKLLSFVSELSSMDPEVAMKVVAEFPNFKTLVIESLEHVKEQAENSVEANWRSQKKVHKAFAQYRIILTNELERQSITSEDRFRILSLLAEAIDKEAAKDSEHKNFVFRMTATLGTIAVAGAGIALAMLGGNTQIGDRSS